MNYIEWADEYSRDTFRIKTVIDRKCRQLKDHKLSADEKKKLSDEIRAYRTIYYELTEIGRTLRNRARVDDSEA